MLDQQKNEKSKNEDEENDQASTGKHVASLTSNVMTEEMIKQVLGNPVLQTVEF